LKINSSYFLFFAVVSFIKELHISGCDFDIVLDNDCIIEKKI
jgi:hypothetical protein